MKPLPLSFALLSALWVVPARAQNAPPAPIKLEHAAFPGNTKQVWINPMWALDKQFDINPGGSAHGDFYPLEMVESKADPDRSIDRIGRLIEAGYTGAQIWMIGREEEKFERWLREAGAHPGFVVAPQIEIFEAERQVETITDWLSSYASQAARFPASAAKVRLDGEAFDGLLVFTYSTNKLSPAQWKAVRAALDAKGIRTFWVGNWGRPGLDPNALRDNKPYFEAFDAHYLFGSASDNGHDERSGWNEVMRFMNEGGRHYAGGMAIGYDRETGHWSGYADNEATVQMRRQWELHLASGLQWVNTITWDDWAERTAQAPTSMWNWTRCDISAFYSAKMRGTAVPARLKTPQLYVTSGTFTRLGETPRAEALVLNTSNQTVRVSLQLFDGNGKAFGAPVSSQIAPNTAGAASTFVSDEFTHTLGIAGATLQTFPTGRFLRARATLTDATGRMVQTVTSAPILVYAPGEVPTPLLRMLYHSIPARQALPGEVKLSLAGNPTSGEYASATLIPPAQTKVRFAEVLQNLRQVKNFYARPLRTVSVPMTPYAGNNYEYQNAEAFGFYMGRVIDEQERVGYSDPVFVPRPKNLLINGDFEGEGGWQSENGVVPSRDISGGAHGGRGVGQHFKTKDVAPQGFAASTRQTVSGLRNGKYTLKAWVRNTDQTPAQIVARDAGGTEQKLDVPRTGGTDSLYNLLTLRDIIVSNATTGANGSCTLEFRSQTAGGERLEWDDVAFYQQT